MVFSKLKNKLLIILCVFIVIFPFWCIKGFCAEPEDVDTIIIDNIVIDEISHSFVSSQNGKTGYIVLEKGYIYTITQDSYPGSRVLFGFTNELPSAGVIVDNFGGLNYNGVFSFNSNDYNYLYFDYSWGNTPMTITRVRNDEMENTVSSLVDNVGLTSLWGVFGDSIDFILVVVLSAFGFFVIFALIKKLRKGKGGI